MAIRRQAAVTPPPVEGVSFGDLGMYVAGGGLPEGDYIIADTQVLMYQAKNQQGVAKGPLRLGVLITFLPLADPKDEHAREQFYSMGTNADKSFAPNPTTGKGIVAIPGASGVTLNESTNWAILLKSLYDSGLPQGVFTNDTSVLEGTWVHVAPIPEPEERKTFRATAATGEAAQDQPNRPGTISVVTEIKDEGKPWEGSGGIPENVPAVKAATGKPSLVGKGKVNGSPATASVNVEEEIITAAINGVSDVLEANANGCPTAKLKTEAFKAIKSKFGGEPIANQVVKDIFENKDAFANVLGQIGYQAVGLMVKPA